MTHGSTFAACSTFVKRCDFCEATVEQCNYHEMLKGEILTQVYLTHFAWCKLACEQALRSGKERRKQRARTSEEMGRGGEERRGRSSSPVYAQLAPLAGA